MKNRRYVLCVMALLGLYLLVRFPLFALHGMKDWPAALLVFGLASVGAGWLLRGKLLPIFTAVGYGAGFFVGVLFARISTDPGGGASSDLWIKWTVVMVCCCLSASLSDLRERKNSNQ